MKMKTKQDKIANYSRWFMAFLISLFFAGQSDLLKPVNAEKKPTKSSAKSSTLSTGTSPPRRFVSSLKGFDFSGRSPKNEKPVEEKTEKPNPIPLPEKASNVVKLICFFLLTSNRQKYLQLHTMATKA